MPLYDWQCEAGHRFTQRAGYDSQLAHCSCGQPASRQSVYRINFGGFAGTPHGQTDFSQDYRRFEEASATVDYKLSRREQETGQPIAVPLYQAAMQQANKLEALGVTADNIST